MMDGAVHDTTTGSGGDGMSGAGDEVARYYATTRALGETWVNHMAAAGIGPHALAIAAGHAALVAVSALHAADAEAGRALLDELASGILKFSESMPQETAA